MPECTALACPRLKDTTLGIFVSAERILRDSTGHLWCELCWKHCELMNYGNRYGWPEVRAQGQQGRYAMLGEAKEWYLSIACGSRDLVDAFYAELIGEQEGKTA